MRTSSTRRTIAAVLLLDGDKDTSATTVTTSAVTNATTGTTTRATTATTAPGPTAYSVADSLRQIPVAALQSGPVLAVSGDLDRASQLAGVDRPAHDADADAVIGWAEAITGLPHDGKNSDVAVVPLDVVRFERIAQIDEIREELGWSALDVATYAGVDSPPQHFGSMTGSFDDTQIDAAQGDRTDGIWSLGGDDFAVDLKTVTAARPLGSSVRTALEDGRLGEAASTPAIEAWVAGSTESLADDPAMMSVAEALDDAAVYSAVVVRGATDAGSTSTPSAPSTAKTDELAPFDAFGAGADHDDNGAQIVLAYHCDDDAGATHNGQALRTLFETGSSDRTRQPWSELVEVDDVHVNGQMVVVTLNVLGGRAPTLAYEAIFSRESFTVSP